MQVTIGEEGLVDSFQDDFPKTTECCKCKGEARIGFVAHEFGIGEYVCDLHDNGDKGDFWLHDACCVAVYFCKECLNPTALCNQA